jgi:hypothetical protein
LGIYVFSNFASSIKVDYEPIDALMAMR